MRMPCQQHPHTAALHQHTLHHTSPFQPLHALPQINACSDDRLEDARREIETLQDLTHPNVLRLLDSCVAVPPGAAAPGSDQLVVDRYAYLLFPAYQVSSCTSATVTPCHLQWWGCANSMQVHGTCRHMQP
jgi:hypothetical protein